MLIPNNTNEFLLPYGQTMCASSQPAVLPHYFCENGRIFSLKKRLIKDVSEREAELFSSIAGNAQYSCVDEETERFLSLFCKRLITFLPQCYADDRQTSGNILVISPHFDDAALSMGGTICRLAGMHCRVDVLNVFSKQSYQTGLTVPKEKILEISEAEERMASSILHYHPISGGLWGFADRHHLQTSQFIGHAELGREHEDLLEKDMLDVYCLLCRILSQKDYQTIYIPKGTGGHLDHVVVRKAALRVCETFCRRGGDLYEYEDQPYTSMMLQPSAENNATEEAFTVDVSDHFAYKVAALLAYCTRIRMQQIVSVANYAQTLHGDRKLYERFCKVSMSEKGVQA